MGYVANIQLANGNIVPIGSTLFGRCTNGIANATKEVSMPNFSVNSNQEIDNGVTIHVFFENGNMATDGLVLNVQNTGNFPIINPSGSLMWSAHSVISFTFVATYGSGAWIMNSSGNTAITAADLQNALGDFKLMSFKGGAATISDLPEQAENGSVYKATAEIVIPAAYANTNNSFTARPGDLLIAVYDTELEHTTWVLIPAGDDADLFIQKQINNEYSNRFVQANGEFKNLTTQNSIVTLDQDTGTLTIYQSVPVGAI